MVCNCCVKHVSGCHTHYHRHRNRIQWNANDMDVRSLVWRYISRTKYAICTNLLARVTLFFFWEWRTEEAEQKVYHSHWFSRKIAYFLKLHPDLLDLSLCVQMCKAFIFHAIIRLASTTYIAQHITTFIFFVLHYIPHFTFNKIIEHSARTVFVVVVGGCFSPFSLVLFWYVGIVSIFSRDVADLLGQFPFFHLFFFCIRSVIRWS